MSASALTEGGPMGRMLTRCAEAMVQHLDAAFAGIWTLDEAGMCRTSGQCRDLYCTSMGP